MIDAKELMNDRRGGALCAGISTLQRKQKGVPHFELGGEPVAGLLIVLDACAEIFKPAECAN
jgi:hypothetical protein